MLMRMKLDVVLDSVVEADDNTLRTFMIITWAESTGNVRRLIDGMVAQMPGNAEVKKLQAASRTWVLDTDSEPAPAPDAIPVVPASADAEAQATHNYLSFLYTRYKHLDFKGMGMADRVPLQLPVADMYVPLKARIELPEGETWSHELRLAGRKMTKAEAENIGKRFSGPQPVLDLLKRYTGLVILGDPGAGKTTFLKYLTVLLALDRGAELGLDRRLPVLVPLSAYATALAQQDVSLQAFMGDYYRSRGIDLPVDRMIDRAMAEGRALIMFDGLDEVQQLAQRTLVVQRVEEFFDFQRQRGNKFILTSRIVGYRSVRPAADRPQGMHAGGLRQRRHPALSGEVDAGAGTGGQGRIDRHAVGRRRGEGRTALCPGAQSGRAPTGRQPAAADDPGADEAAGRAAAGAPRAVV
jgi:energy-coupling factor transporter ATP-binding protein EcfA2